MSFFRIQDADRPNILDPENHVSYSWNNLEDFRHGISACESRGELADYLAQTGIPFSDDSVLVEFDGDYADEDDEDAHLGAVLTIPARIIATEKVGESFGLEVMEAYETQLNAA